MTLNDFVTVYVLFGLIRSVWVMSVYLRSEKADDIPRWLSLPIIVTVGALWGLPLFIIGKVEAIWGAK